MAKEQNKVTSSEKKVSKKDKKRMERQAFLFFLAIIIFLGAIILAPYLYHEIFGKFSYAGIQFEKTKSGSVDFYHGVFPVVLQGKFYHDFNLYLRHDPRKNDIPINATFRLSNNVSIGFEKGAIRCPDAVLGQSLMGQFFGSFPTVKEIEVGMINYTDARDNSLPQITCKNASASNKVFIIQKSETPSITLGENSNCFVLNVGNCKDLETIERYVVGSIAQINQVSI